MLNHLLPWCLSDSDNLHVLEGSVFAESLFPGESTSVDMSALTNPESLTFVCLGLEPCMEVNQSLEYKKVGVCPLQKITKGNLKHLCNSPSIRRLLDKREH